MQLEDYGDGKAKLDANNFVRLKDGESVKGVFGNAKPFIQYTHFFGQASAPEDCGKDSGRGCEHCADNHRPTWRFRLNFFVQNPNGSFTQKILEQGRKFYATMFELNKEVPLEKYITKISRTGSGMNDTVYSIIALPTGQLTVAQQKEILSQPLMDLGFKAEKTQADQTREEIMDRATMEDTDLPF